MNNNQPTKFEIEELILFAPLAIEIKKWYLKLEKKIDCLSDELRFVKLMMWTTGECSAVDIIAYLIGWGNLLIYWYKEGAKSTNFIMPGEGFSTWDYNKIAVHFYQKYKYDGNFKQREALAKVVWKILHIVEKEHNRENLNKIGVWNWTVLRSGRPWPLSKWIRINTVSPYKRACLELNNLREAV